MDDEISFETVDESGKEESLESKIKKLRQELAQCTQEKQSYLEGWQRSKADFVNARKLEESSRKEMVQYAASAVIKDMLDVVDTFEMAFAHKESWEKVDKNWRIGVESIYSKLEGVLESHGVTSVTPKIGEKFNPEIHQAVAGEETSAEDADDTIVQVVQKGYQLHGRILRPAKVKVAHYESKEEI